jgi:uncharacterized protein YxeA
MKKILIISFAVVVVIITGFTILSKASIYGITDQQKSACKNAFEGKCLHGGSINTSDFFDVSQIVSYCAAGNTFCTAEECEARLKAITGLGGASVGSSGYPCLPQ